MDPQNPQPNDSQANDQPWLSPAKGESNTWFDRFSKFLALGPARTVNAAYTSESKKLVKPRQSSSPRASSAWYDASRRFDWDKRAQAYDAHLRKTLLSSGNAMDTERIKKLDVLIDKLHERILVMLSSALPDERFNEKLVAQFLAAIDLMAKHTGSYVQRLEHTGKDGGKIEVDETQTKLNVVWYMPEVAPLDDGTAVEEEPGDDGDPVEQS